MEFVLNLEHQDISHMTEEEFQSALNSSKEAFEQMNPSGGVGERGV